MRTPDEQALHGERRARALREQAVGEERPPSPPSLDLDTSPPTDAVRSAYGRRLHTPTLKQRWKKSKNPPLPKIEDCPQPLRRRLEQQLAALIEKSKQKNERDSLPDWWIKSLTGVAWQMVMVPKAERSQMARIRFARQCGRSSVLKRKQRGTFESHMARMRMAKEGWRQLRERDEEGKQEYLAWKNGKEIRNAWKVWKTPPKRA